MSAILSLHHVTAIAGDPQKNLDFYAGVLGMRLVKRTVNFDDPGTYHFYFADEVGTPGTILTFFPFPGARRGRVGSGQVAITSFAVLPSAIGFWVERFTRHGVTFDEPVRRGKGAELEHVLAFRDHDGLMLELVGHPAAEGRPAWERAPGIHPEDALRGFHSVTLWETRGEDTERLLVDTMGLHPVRESATTRRFTTANGAPGTLVDLRSVSEFPRGTGGAGTVHHVAWSVRDDEAQLAMRERVAAAGLSPTPVIDRDYFHSVYFREPGGVLFELATLPPGFAVDEPVERLGEKLMLPPQYERQRSTIEAALPPVHAPSGAAPGGVAAGGTAARGGSPGFVHRYLAATTAAGPIADTTLLLLHGTGGDEDDLVPLGRTLLPGAAILSPRGKVLENGFPRFFRRIAEGVFDQEDLAFRTEELAEFIEGAVREYGLAREGIVAVGFSNGANIATSLLLRKPGLLHRAVLFSAMVPFEPETAVDLGGTRAFLGAGETDPIAPRARTERLAEILRAMGSEVTLHWSRGGHELIPGAVKAAREWLGR